MDAEMVETTFKVAQLYRDDVPLTIGITSGRALGQIYTGRWGYLVCWNGEEVISGDDLDPPPRSTHLDAARVLALVLAAYGDPHVGYDGKGRPTGRALEMCRAEHERLSWWVTD